MLNFLLNRFRGHTRPLFITITVVVEPDGDSYHVYCPALKGLHADGATEEEAVRNAQEAILLYLESHQKHGDPLPIGPDLTVEDTVMRNISPEAHLRKFNLQWPCLTTSGSKLRIYQQTTS